MAGAAWRRRRRWLAAAVLVGGMLILRIDGGGGTAGASALGPATPHLVVVVMENKEFGQVVGNANAPYINRTLFPGGKRFRNEYAPLHPSLPNYLVLTSGRYGGCFDDACPRNSDRDDNLFHQMNVAAPAISWKVYAESMPSNCALSDAGPYTVHHNPPTYYTNLGPSGDGSCATKDVPYSQLSADLAAGTLPQFAMVVPNVYSDMHTDANTPPCQLGAAVQNEVCQGDRWLQANLPPLLSDGGRNDVTAVVVFDEGTTNLGGGGHILSIELGPNVTGGATDDHFLTHAGLVNALARWFGLPGFAPLEPQL
jgi:hypothetical protein